MAPCQTRTAPSGWIGKSITEKAPGRNCDWYGPRPAALLSSAPVRRGFGSRLIERSARDQLGGEATIDFLPRGAVYTVVCSLEDEG